MKTKTILNTLVKFKSTRCFLGAVLLWAGVFLACFVKANPGVVQEIFQGRAVQESAREARIEILKQAREHVIKQKAEQMLGRKLSPESMEKLLAQSGLYILREKTGRLRSVGAGIFEAQVQMDVNIQALRRQLLKEGLFYQFKQKPRVLVAVSFIDYIGAKSFSWWQDVDNNTTLLTNFKKNLNSVLVEKFQDQNIFQLILKPTPMALKRKQASALSRKNFFQLAKKNKAQVLVQGRIVLQNNPPAQSSSQSDKSRGDQSRSDKSRSDQSNNKHQFKTSLDLFYVGEHRLEPLGQIAQNNSLANYAQARVEFAKIKTQLAEKTSKALDLLWQKGDLGTLKFVIKVQHNLNAVDLESFKKMLAVRVPSLRQLKERFIYSQVVGFEARSFLTARALSSQIQPEKLLPFKMKLKSVSDDLIELRVER